MRRKLRFDIHERYEHVSNSMIDLITWFSIEFDDEIEQSAAWISG